MSATETPTPQTRVERRCPRCGAPLSAEQEWCLDCGTAVGTVIAEPRGWRGPVAIVGVLLAIALIALILAIVELAKPSEQITEVPQTPTPAPAAATPTPTTSPGTPTPSATPSATPAAKLATWPAGRSAWTIVLNSSGTRADAERLAAELQGKGIAGIGVIDSNDFESLGPDSFVVFSGVYSSQALADEALAQIKDQAGGGSTRRIVPKKK